MKDGGLIGDGVVASENHAWSAWTALRRLETRGSNFSPYSRNGIYENYWRYRQITERDQAYRFRIREIHGHGCSFYLKNRMVRHFMR